MKKNYLFLFAAATMAQFTSAQTNSFNLHSTFALSYRTYNPKSEDFNGDGKKDIMFMDDAGQIRLYANDGLANFSAYSVATTIMTMNIEGTSFETSDLDNDNDLDILMPNGLIYLNNGSGVFTQLAGADFKPASVTGIIADIDVFDVNGDGKKDIVWLNLSYQDLATQPNQVWLNTGTLQAPVYTYYSQWTNELSGQRVNMTSGDVDGDGDLDLLTSASSNNAQILKNDGNGNFTNFQIFGRYNKNAKFVDWDNDGDLDVISTDSYNSYGTWLYTNNGTGTFNTAGTALITPSIIQTDGATVPTALPYESLFFDYNNDGRKDVVYINVGNINSVLGTDANSALSLNQGNNNVELRASVPIGIYNVADYNNDGKLDFFGSNGTEYQIYLNDMVNVPLATAPATQTFCSGATVANLTATGSTLKWYNQPKYGTALQSTATLTTGTYYVSQTINNAEGARIAVNVIVSNLAATTQATAATCNGSANGSATVNATSGIAPFTYAWSNGATTSEVQNLEAGTYSVIITDAAGCTTTKNVIITEPQAIVITTGLITHVACYGNNTGTAQISANGGSGQYTYLWENGATTSVIENVPAGAYEVTVTDSNGCSATELIMISQPAEPLTTEQFDLINVSCLGGNNGRVAVGVYGGTEPYQYTWDNGATTSVLENLVAGTYNVQITDANGCIATREFIVNDGAPLVANITRTDDTLTVTPTTNATYQWGSCGSENTFTPINNATSQSFTALETGNFAVMVSANGCSTVSDCYAVTALGVNDLQKTVTFTATPNPSNGVLNIQASVNGTIAVYDMLGKALLNTKINAGNNNVNLTNLEDAVYVIRFSGDNNTQKTIKVVKQSK